MKKVLGQVLLSIAIATITACLLFIATSSILNKYNTRTDKLEQQVSELTELNESKDLWISDLERQVTAIRANTDSLNQDSTYNAELESRITDLEQSLERLTPQLNESINSNAPTTR